MSSDLQRRLNIYKKLQSEIIDIDKDIERKRDNMECIISILVEKQARKGRIASSLNGATVRLGNLIKELSNLSGIRYEDIKVEIGSGISRYGKYTKFEMDSMQTNNSEKNLRNNNQVLSITISGLNRETTEAQPFYYSALFVPFDFEAIQADGKPMHEHMDVKYQKDSENRVYTEYVVNKKVKNIIITIPLEYLNYQDENYWIPADLFTTAVINCVERDSSLKKLNEDSKKRKRKKEQQKK